MINGPVQLNKRNSQTGCDDESRDAQKSYIILEISCLIRNLERAAERHAIGTRESCFFILQNGNRDSAVGIATNHGVQMPTGVKDFPLSKSVLTVSGGPHIFHLNGYREFFPGVTVNGA